MEKGNVIVSSTYQEDFQNIHMLPPLFDFQPQRFDDDKEKLPQRCFPFSQPIVPHRKRDSEIPIAPGFSTFLHRVSRTNKDNFLKPILKKETHSSSSASQKRNSTENKSDKESDSLSTFRCQNLESRSVFVSRKLESKPASECPSPVLKSTSSCLRTGPSSCLGSSAQASARQTPNCTTPSSASKHAERQATGGKTTLVPELVLQELVKLGHYTPSSQNNSCFIRKPKQERLLTPEMRREFWRKNPHRDGIINSGRVLGQSQNKPEIWQTVGCMWDKLQDRKPIAPSMRAVQQDTQRLLSRPRVGEENKNFNTFGYTNMLSSNIPGYSGCRPQLLPNRTKAQTCGFQSISRLTYREHPKVTYRLPSYGHRAPMSRTVTLTEPYNPFNKVEPELLVI
ncbi:uncharacterized protein [Clytia hemisphaerica]